MSTPAASAVERVCIFAQIARTGLGDLVMRNALFELVRRAYPTARTTLVVGANDAADFQDFLANHAPVDDILACPPCDAGPPADSPGEWKALLDELRRGDFQACVVDAGTLWLHAQVARDAGIPTRIGLRRGHDQEEHLTVAAPIEARNGGEPDLADYLAAYAVALGMPPPRADAVVPPFRFEPAGQSLRLPRPRVAMHVGGGTYWNRRWPLDNYLALCERLLDSGGGSIVLVGTQEREEHTYLLAGAEDRLRGRMVEVGDVSLARTASALSQCDLFVGNDSGPMHLAVAVGIPTITLYGPADGEFFWDHVYPGHHPIGRHWRCQLIPHEWPTRDRAPCEYRCRYSVRHEAPEYPRCVADISVDEVFDTVGNVLDGLPDPGGRGMFG